MEERVQRVLREIRDCCLACFSEDLTGVYVHGSLALGCFYWNKSDIDFIVVVKRPPSMEQKVSFLRALLEIDRHSPPKGLEMSVVLEDCTRKFVYPTPFELHFSNDHKQRCMEDPFSYCQSMHGTDRDLAAHFTIIRHACICLSGAPEASVFGEVPPDAYFDSLKYDIAHADEEILQNPVYMILNLCRVLAYRRQGLILSKKDGGLWGLRQLPARFHGLLHGALRCYQSDADAPIAEERLLLEFAEYMRCAIY